MYEHFTDRARKVMQLAKQEAQNFRHEYVGTEHILLGLIKENSGVAAHVLKNLGISLLKAEELVRKIVQPGPDEVMLGKIPHTPRAKKVIDYAIEEARNINHNYVGTEHLLLGLLRETEGIAAQVLIECGCNLEAIREECLDLLGKPDPIKKEQQQKQLDEYYTNIVKQVKELCDDGKLPPQETFEQILKLVKVPTKQVDWML